MGISVTIDINDTIISDFTIMLGEIIWRDMTVSGSEFWYSRTWNPSIVAILDIKPFWTSLFGNWDIVVSDNCINSSFTSNTWYLNLGGNYIFIGMESVKFCDIWLCDLSIHD